jgi:hypothetical protein
MHTKIHIHTPPHTTALHSIQRERNKERKEGKNKEDKTRDPRQQSQKHK